MSCYHTWWTNKKWDQAGKWCEPRSIKINIQLHHVKAWNWKAICQELHTCKITPFSRPHSQVQVHYSFLNFKSQASCSNYRMVKLWQHALSARINACTPVSFCLNCWDGTVELVVIVGGFELIKVCAQVPACHPFLLAPCYELATGTKITYAIDVHSCTLILKLYV
jgi:hypothetical protein